MLRLFSLHSQHTHTHTHTNTYTRTHTHTHIHTYSHTLFNGVYGPRRLCGERRRGEQILFTFYGFLLLEPNESNILCEWENPLFFFVMTHVLLLPCSMYLQKKGSRKRMFRILEKFSVRKFI